MPRFSDQWLIDRTLFDYVQGGSCACCSFAFLPNGTAGMIQSMSEFETDAANAEVSALDKLPWPPEMKDQVWMERVRLRQFLKSSMPTYRIFWKEHGESYQNWFMDIPSPKLKKLFQLPRNEIVERLKQQKFQMHASFGTVLCAVTEQVAHYEITKYPPDGRRDAELGFESSLIFDRRGGFTLSDIESDETKQSWLLRHKSLGGPKLLERNPKIKKQSDGDDSSSDDDEEEGGVDDNDNQNTNGDDDVPSFRSDRRIVRLVIARHFADVLQRAYFKDNPPPPTTATATEPLPN